MEQLKNFIVELITRFISPTPKFFTILKTISLVLVLVASAPSILEAFGFTLNIGISAAVQKIVAISAFVAAVVAQLTKQDPANTPPKTGV